MESDRFEELALLAESIADENFKNGKTDLIAILNRNEIRLIKGYYEDCFLGNLVHCSKKFYLYLNMESLQESQQPRVRFTIAHELGHYFIDEHRNLLKKGTSLSFNKKHNNLTIEKEANHFASFLLMPTAKFKTPAATYENGLSTILALAMTFESSIDSASIHYIKLNCCPGLLIRWNEDNSVKSWVCSYDFSQSINSDLKPLIKISNSYLDNLKKQLSSELNRYQVYETATPLSRWLPSIPTGSANDQMALEQTVKLGKYGGITLILLPPK